MAFWLLQALFKLGRLAKIEELVDINILIRHSIIYFSPLLLDANHGTSSPKP